MLNLALVHEQRNRIRDLSGFRKTHRIPTEDSDRARRFVARIASEEINQDLDQRFAVFRRELGLKRAELEVSDADSGRGSIRTPGFLYQISITLDADEMSQAVWRRRVAEFPDPAPLLSAEFTRAFGLLFDTVEFEPPEPVKIGSLIDQMENEPIDQLQLDYDRSSTWCRLCAPHLNAEMTVRQDRITMQSLQPQPPSELLQSFFNVREQLQGIAWMRTT